MLNKLHDALGLRTSPAIFFPAVLIVIGFAVATMFFSDAMIGFFGLGSHVLIEYMGWFYVLGTACFFLFLIWVAFSRFGRIKLGPDDSTPRYSTPAWFGMMFAAGVGAVLMFWGAAEPITHFANPPYGAEPRSYEAALQAIAVTDFHIGLFMWVVLAVPALVFGYFTYKRKLPPRVSSALQPLLGDGIHGPIGRVVDVFSVVATVFGVGVSVGLGALQLNSGIHIMYGVPIHGAIQALIIAIITGVALTSVLSGMDKGVKRLSNFNIGLAVVLLIYLLMMGSTVFVTRGTVEAFGSFLDMLPRMAFFNDTFANTGWLGKWTVFYWAWTITWAPFVGLFLAKISQGRSIREFVMCALALPTLFTMVWVGVFAMNAFDIEFRGNGGLVHTVVDQGDIPGALFQFLGNFPLLPVTSVVALVLITVFFVTSIDSAALVMDSMANGHEDPAPLRQRVFWSLSIGIVCASILWSAGESGLDALQNVIIIVGFPVFLVTLVQILMLIRALREDAGELPPMRTRQWKKVLPMEEYRRRATDDYESVQEFSMRPEFDEDTAPEHEAYVPNTYQVRKNAAAEADGAACSDGQTQGPGEQNTEAQSSGERPTS